MRTKTDIDKSKPWKVVGGPQAGTISALALAVGGSEGERYTIFIGAKSGLYRSHGFDGVSDPKGGWERLPAAPLGVMALAVSPEYSSDHLLIAGTDTGLYLSKDGGDTWSAAQTPVSRSMVLSLCFSLNYAVDGIVLAGTLEDGIWYSPTRGESWLARSFGLLDATVYCLAISANISQDEVADEIAIAGTDTAIYYSYNQARAWKQLPFPDSAAPVMSLAISPNFQSDGTVYAGTESQGLYRSIDQGVSWEKTGLPAACVNALLISQSTGRSHPHSNLLEGESVQETNLLAATEAGIYRSNDKGETWECLVDIPDAISMISRQPLIIAGLVDQGAWMTSNGFDWQPISIPPIRSILGLSLSPGFENDGMAFMYGLQEGIWRTEDGGAIWQPVNENLPSLDIQALAVSPRFLENRIIAATSPDGVFLSEDAGDHWTTVAQGPAGVLAFSPDGNFLAVDMLDEGMQISDDSGQTWETVPGPWDSGVRTVSLALTNGLHFYAALLEGVNDTLIIFQGKPGQYEKLLSEPTPSNPVVSFWIPTGPAVNRPWYASLGSKVWRFSTRKGGSVVELGLPVDVDRSEDILSISGTQTPEGQTLFACTGRRIYKSLDARTWSLVHDFGNEIAISFSLSPSYLTNKAAYALLLGGSFCRGLLR